MIFCISTSGRKRTKSRISRLWKTLQILSEASLCCPKSQETFVPLKPMAISFLLLKGSEIPLRGFTQKALITGDWDYISMEKNSFNFSHKSEPPQDSQTEKNQTKTPLKELTNFSSTECIFTQLQTSKQKPNPA